MKLDINFIWQGVLGTIVFGLLTYSRHKRHMKLAIEDIRINFRFFPKHYAMPPRWIRKHFNLRKKEIPKFCLFGLYVAIFDLYSILIEIPLVMIAPFAFGVWILIDIFVNFVVAMYLLIMDTIYQKVYKTYDDKQNDKQNDK